MPPSPPAIPITGYDNDGHSEIFRYDAPEDTIACASCNPTGARATGERLDGRATASA